MSQTKLPFLEKTHYSNGVKKGILKNGCSVDIYKNYPHLYSRPFHNSHQQSSSLKYAPTEKSFEENQNLFNRNSKKNYKEDDMKNIGHQHFNDDPMKEYFPKSFDENLIAEIENLKDLLVIKNNEMERVKSKLRIVENEYLETKSKIYYGASDESQYSKKHANENEKENSLLKSKIMDLEFMLEEKQKVINEMEKDISHEKMHKKEETEFMNLLLEEIRSMVEENCLNFDVLEKLFVNISDKNMREETFKILGKLMNIFMTFSYQVFDSKSQLSKLINFSDYIRQIEILKSNVKMSESTRVAILSDNQKLKENLTLFSEQIGNLNTKTNEFADTFQTKTQNIQMKLQNIDTKRKEMAATYERRLREKEQYYLNETNIKNDELKKMAENIEKQQITYAKLKDSFEQNIKELQTQVKEHSFTILALENEKDEMNNINHALTSEKLEMTQWTIESESKTAELIKSLKYKVVNFKKKITSLQKTIDEQNEVIWNLKDKLKKNCETAEEITEKLIEEKGEIIEKKNLELIELKKSLEVLTEENEAFRNNQKHIHFEIERLKKEVEIKNERLKTMGDELEKLSHETEALRIDTHRKIGIACQAKHHEETINRQREYLIELTAKIKALESGDNPLLLKEEAVQQVAFMRREIEALKVVHLCKVKLDQIDPGVSEEGVSARQLFAMNKLTESLELSENIYAGLLKQLGKCLGLGTPTLVRSLISCRSNEDMTYLLNERSHMAKELAEKIQELKTQVVSDKKTLANYHRDKEKLRILQDLNEKSNRNLDILSNELIMKRDETQRLKDSLYKSNEKLHVKRQNRRDHINSKKNVVK